MSDPLSDPSNPSKQRPSRASPRDWEGCPSMGDLIEGVFLPFKTPLENSKIEPDLRFGTQDFLDEIKRRGLNVGLIVNLCNTQKYYEVDDFRNAGLDYVNISCPGKQVPRVGEVKRFVIICKTFLKKNPGKIIAVHCTHGFNRTGFMICYYLCSEHDSSLKSAVSLFASKRNPGIYRQYLLDELYEKYGSWRDVVEKAPPKPDWCRQNSSQRAEAIGKKFTNMRLNP